MGESGVRLKTWGKESSQSKGPSETSLVMNYKTPCSTQMPRGRGKSARAGPQEQA